MTNFTRICYIITIKKYYVYIISVVAVCSFIISYILISTCLYKDHSYCRHSPTPTTVYVPIIRETDDLFSNLADNADWRNKITLRRMERLAQNLKKSRSIIMNNKPAKVDYNIHIFYYAWYGNIQTDGEYRHWNHIYLQNWRKNNRKIYPTGSHVPPNDIGSNFYPALGSYSSRNMNVINTHMRHLQRAGVGVIILSWLPSKYPDSPHDILHTLFNAAVKYQLKIALHIESYPGRNPINLQEELRIFYKTFRNHNALYKIKKPLSGKELPVLYIYDSYLTPAVAWKELLGTKGNLSIRGTELDAIYIGLLADTQHKYHIKKSQFDGFYTYFAINGFTYGSSWKNWKVLSKFALENGLIFIPSVSPGYIDTQVRPWNSASIRHRRHGQYYDVAWRSAIDIHASYVSITSFNEWHEGTQIEPAQTKSVSYFTYLDYEPEGTDFYLNLTKWWIQQFEKSLS